MCVCVCVQEFVCCVDVQEEKKLGRRLSKDFIKTAGKKGRRMSRAVVERRMSRASGSSAGNYISLCGIR